MTETMSPELRCLLPKRRRLGGGDEEKESDRVKQRAAGLFGTERLNAVNLNIL